MKTKLTEMEEILALDKRLTRRLKALKSYVLDMATWNGYRKYRADIDTGDIMPIITPKEPEARKIEKCPDGLIPDGDTCPKCGGNRAPSGADGGSWVHHTPSFSDQELKEVEKCMEKLRILRGIPPHDVPSNLCRSDNYFAMSIEREFNHTIRKEAEIRLAAIPAPTAQSGIALSIDGVLTVEVKNERRTFNRDTRAIFQHRDPSEKG